MKSLIKLSHNIIRVSKSPKETFEIAKELATSIKSPALIGISGELGSGKTVFVKGFACGINVKELITSPTFLGISESYSGRLPFVHMDFYKKVISKEIVDSYLKKDSVVIIEWVENYEQIFKEKLRTNISVNIEYLKDQNERQITLCYTK